MFARIGTAVSLLLLSAAFFNAASAQEVPAANAIDAESPPAGFVAPKPDGLRDLSMPKYARESFLAGEKGIVGLRAHVRQDGTVAEAQIATSSGSSRLDQAAKDVVEDWRYQPATLNGSPVPAWISVEVIWALQTLRFELTPQQARNLGAYYPRGLREQGVSTVRFLAMPDGTISKAFIDRSSGTPRLDLAAIEMVTRGWSFAPGTLTTNETVGGWFRLNVVFVLPGSRTPPSYAPCGLPAARPDRDALIRACTEFLTRTDLSSYERADTYRIRGNARVANREFDDAIADFSAGVRASPDMQSYMSHARGRI